MLCNCLIAKQLATSPSNHSSESSSGKVATELSSSCETSAGNSSKGLAWSNPGDPAAEDSAPKSCRRATPAPAPNTADAFPTVSSLFTDSSTWRFPSRPFDALHQQLFNNIWVGISFSRKTYQGLWPYHPCASVSRTSSPPPIPLPKSRTSWQQSANYRCRFSIDSLNRLSKKRGAKRISVMLFP